MKELATTWMLCDTASVGKFYITYPRVLPRSARASPAVKHGVSPLGTVGENISIKGDRCTKGGRSQRNSGQKKLTPPAEAHHA